MNRRRAALLPSSERSTIEAIAARDQPAKCGAHFRTERHVGMPAAEDDNRIAGGRAIGAGAQAPPNPERIDHRDPRPRRQQPLDIPLGRVRLARAGRADDRDPLVERIGGQDSRRSPHGSSRRFSGHR